MTVIDAAGEDRDDALLREMFDTLETVGGDRLILIDFLDGEAVARRVKLGRRWRYSRVASVYGRGIAA